VASTSSEFRTPGSYLCLPESVDDVAALREAWGSVEQWLATHAPRTPAAVARPGDAAGVERAIGGTLPADVVEWYCLAGGLLYDVVHLAGHLIPQWHDPHTISEATDTWRMRQQVLLDETPAQDTGQLKRFFADVGNRPAGTPGPEDDIPIWIPAWFPFAGDGGGGLLIDLRHGPLHGCVLSFDRYTNPIGPVWLSVTAMWSDVARRLPTPSTAVPDPIAESWYPSSE
jgi:cell wall assembly regulator SMI1